MPNWCKNRLTVIGPSEKVVAFISKAHGEYHHFTPGKYNLFNEESLKKIQGEDYKTPEQNRKENPQQLSFHQLIPIPDHVMAKEYDPYGIDTERRLWGVKWGSYESELISYKDGQALYEFNTPWGPPNTFLENVSYEWSDLGFALSFVEEYPTRGRLLARNGKIAIVANERTPFKGSRNMYYTSHNKWVKTL